jgi:hypothetical protein
VRIDDVEKMNINPLLIVAILVFGLLLIGIMLTIAEFKELNKKQTTDKTS